MNDSRTSSSGQALVEVLVASAIVMVIMGTLVSLLQTQAQETRALNQKLNALELQRALTLIMTDSSVCQQMIQNTPLSISGSALSGQALKSIPSSSATGASDLITRGAAVSSTAPDLVVDSIYFDEIAGTGTPNQFMAWLRVSFETRGLVRPLKPVGVRFTLTTDPSTNKVNGCIMNGSSAPGSTGTLTSPGGKCTVVQKAFVRGSPNPPNASGWSSMAVTCPSSFPVTVSVNTTPAEYAPWWNARYLAASPPGYFSGGICDMLFVRDDPRTTPFALATFAGHNIDQGLCSVMCCNL